MKKKILKKARIVTILAAIVVFLTIYSLVLPAVAITKPTAEEEPGIEISESIYTTEENERISFNEENEETSKENSGNIQESAVNVEEKREEESTVQDVSYPAVSFLILWAI